MGYLISQASQALYEGPSIGTPVPVAPVHLVLPAAKPWCFHFLESRQDFQFLQVDY